MNKAVIFFSAFSLIILLSHFISAGILAPNASIGYLYAPNSTILGWVNMSLSNVPIDSYIFSNVGGTGISLRQLLTQQSFSYSCNTADCNSSYSIIGSQSPTESFNLITGQPQTYGFLVTGKSPNISSGNYFSLNVTSDAPLSSMPQLSVDMLNDGSSEWTAYHSSGIWGSSNYGCYNSALHSSQGTTSYLGPALYCERISFPISSQVNIGANVIGSGNAAFKMSIQDVNMTSALGVCSSSISSTGLVNCTAQIIGTSNNYSIKTPGNFWVCINQTSGNGYSINTSTSSSSCGFVGSYQGSYTIDFQVFGASVLFSPVGSFIFNDTEATNSGYAGSNLESEITSYLQNKYDNNCTSISCVIPVGFNDTVNQTVNLSNLNLFVDTADQGRILVNSLYNVSVSSALVNTNGYKIFSLNSAGFVTPGNFGVSNFTLTLYDGVNSYTLLSQAINVTKIPQIYSISPNTAPAAVPTNFTANINYFNTNISGLQYQWNFGDGSQNQTTTTNMISHTYGNIGTFNLSVIVSNQQGLSSSGNFAISVVAPKDAVNQTLTADLQDVTNIQNEIGNYPTFVQTSLKNILKLANTSSLLQSLQNKSNNAVNDSDYVGILNSLQAINLPQEVQLSTTANSVPFVQSGDTINLDAVKRIGGTYDSSKKDDYVNAILNWDISNISLNIDYSEYSAAYGQLITPILDVVKVTATGNPPANSYLFIPVLDNISLDKSYNLTGSYYNIPLSSGKIVQFSTTDSFSPYELPIFISPSLDQITLPQTNTTSDNRMIIFIIILGAVVLVGIISYIAIGRWYQRRYESYLFKDRNDLYNMINYINTSKLKGLKQNEIENNLRKAKWTNEQISYVMKKYSGKRVGVPGFK